MKKKRKDGEKRPYVRTSKRGRGNAGTQDLCPPEVVAKIAEMCEAGLTDLEIAAEVGIAVRTLHRWKHNRPELQQVMKIGKAIADNRVERSLYELATGYSYEAVKIHVNADGMVTQVPYIEHVPPNPTAMIFWLKNRAPDTWRDVHRTEVTGKDGGPIETAAKLSDAELSAKIAELAAKYGFERKQT